MPINLLKKTSMVIVISSMGFFSTSTITMAADCSTLMNHDMEMDDVMEMNHDMPTDQDMGMNHDMSGDRDMEMDDVMEMDHDMSGDHVMEMDHDMLADHVMGMNNDTPTNCSIMTKAKFKHRHHRHSPLKK